MQAVEFKQSQYIIRKSVTKGKLGPLPVLMHAP